MSNDGSEWAKARFMKEYRASKGSSGSSSSIKNKIGNPRKITRGRLGNVEFQVNPTTIEYGGGKEWAEVHSPGRQVPLMQLGCGKSNTFSFELYINEWMFDRKVNADEFVAEIFRCRGSRETVKFIYGKMVRDVVVNDCKILVQSFKPDLSFREVTMSVTLTIVYL